MLHTTQHINVFQYNIELINGMDKEEDVEQLLVTFSSYSLVLINNNENTTIS